MTYKKSILKNNYYCEAIPIYGSLPDTLAKPGDIRMEMLNEVTTEKEMKDRWNLDSAALTASEAFGLAASIIEEGKNRDKWNIIWFKNNDGRLCYCGVYWYGGGWDVRVDEWYADYCWGAGNRVFRRNTASLSDTLEQAIKICKDNGLKVIRVTEEEL